MRKKKTTERSIVTNMRFKDAQIKALRTLGFKYIIVGECKRRLYAFFDTDIKHLCDYAKINGLALNIDLFPSILISRLEKDTFYKI